MIILVFHHVITFCFSFQFLQWWNVTSLSQTKERGAAEVIQSWGIHSSCSAPRQRIAEQGHAFWKTQIIRAKWNLHRRKYVFIFLFYVRIKIYHRITFHVDRACNFSRVSLTKKMFKFYMYQREHIAISRLHYSCTSDARSDLHALK